MGVAGTERGRYVTFQRVLVRPESGLSSGGHGAHHQADEPAAHQEDGECHQDLEPDAGAHSKATADQCCTFMRLLLDE